MDRSAFATELDTDQEGLVGPWRAPRQLLADQSYDAHASIHDDATAQRLGFRGGTIEGPTHFSQFAPLAHRLWGDRFFETGRISAHYRAPVYEGEEVRAILTPAGVMSTHAGIRMEKRDGTEVLRGTASVGDDRTPSALEARLAGLPHLEQAVILRDLKVSDRTSRQTVRMAYDQHMGELYPFSLERKLTAITEPSPWYDPATAAASPWGRAIIPLEMISVLLQYRAREDRLRVRGPSVGLFADQEIHLLDGPLFVDEPYDIEREVVALSGSRRTESYWLKTTVFRAGETAPVAVMLLNHAVLKDSYAPYEAEHSDLFGGS